METKIFISNKILIVNPLKIEQFYNTFLIKLNLNRENLDNQCAEMQAY